MRSLKIGALVALSEGCAARRCRGFDRVPDTGVRGVLVRHVVRSVRREAGRRGGVDVGYRSPDASSEPSSRDCFSGGVRPLMTWHFHGTPITPRTQLLRLAGRCFCVRYGAHGDVNVCHEIGQSNMLDNGAFSFWRKGLATDWPGYYDWCEPWLDYRTTWAVIPDVIDGGVEENDALIREWPFGDRGAPVWHMHEPIDRLLRLADEWPRVCIGSSGQYATVGDDRWHRRMERAMNTLCGNGPAPVWLHMLRGLDQADGPYPFASADSTNVAQNHSRNGGAVRMVEQIDARQSPGRWRLVPEPVELAA